MKYVCYYDIDGKENRHYVLSAKNKIDYILSTLEKIFEENIEIISASTTKDKRSYRGRQESISPKISLKMFRTFGRGSFFSKLFDFLFIPVYLFFYLLISAKKNENVIVYHSLSYIVPVGLAKKIKRFHLILELEEIYSDVSGDKKSRKKELRFADMADAYIFPTQLLDKQINIARKPSVIIHGTYQVEPIKKCNIFTRELQEGEIRKIHCVYAGTFDPRKGGAIAAAAAAAHLSFNYHIHILGFGNETDTKNMQDLVSELAKKSKATITYDGLLSGEDYIQFIQSCDIGLSTQNPDAEFNATSFPSKILSYMANGLRVVSIRIPAIEQSSIGEYMYYYDKQTPEEIAKAILAVDISDKYNGRKIIEKLDIKFRNDLKRLFEEVNDPS